MDTKRRAATAALVLCGLINPTAFAGQFKSGLGKGDSLKAAVPLAPEVRIVARTLSIDVRDARNLLDALSGRIRPSIENALANGPWSIAPVGGNAVLRVEISDYVPPQSFIRQVTRVIQVPRVAPNGAVIVDAYGRPLYVNRRVVIDHWTGRGRIGVRVEAVDTKSGALIDTFAAGGGFDNQADVSVNGADQVDRSQLPTREQIENKLISDIAVQFAKRYNPGLEEVEIPLSVADELRAGNKLAKAGDYHAALQSWEASVPRKLDAMGDKHHNAGCFHEMMAYGLLRESGGTNLSGTQEELSKAMELYSQALRQDPKEKYFQQAVDRIRRASGVVDRLRSSQAAYEQAIASLRPASAWPPFAPAGKKNAVAAQEVEVDKTAQFRELVQARLKALESKSTPEVEA